MIKTLPKAITLNHIVSQRNIHRHESKCHSIRYGKSREKYNDN